MKKSGLRPFVAMQLLVTVAVTAAITAALAWYWMSRADLRGAVAEAAGSFDHRVVQARVTGFPHRPLRTPRGSETAQTERTRVKAAALVDQAGRGSDDVQRAHAAGVSHLFYQNWDRAVHSLQDALCLETGEDTIAAAIKKSTDAALLSDFAAAHHTRARFHNRLHDYVVAAEAASRAWSIERTPETAWNRALTVEALSMREAAIGAWRDYLALDDDSPWVAEVREHLATLAAPTTAAGWRDARPLLERAVTRGDHKTVAQLVSRFPEHARMTAEREYLPRWPAQGERSLALCRAIGRALRDGTGESLLYETVAHIDAADETRRTALARALRIYGEAVDARDRLYLIDVARPLFRTAFEELRRSGSPFAGAARLFLWNCERYENDRRVVTETGQWLAEPPGNHPALVAQVRWSRGLSLIRTGQPQAAIDEYSRALALFARLGEMDNVAAMHAMLSEGYDQVGDSDEAWKHRFAALERVGASGTSHSALKEAPRLSAVAALKEGFPSVAVLLLDRQLAATDPVSERDILVSTLLWRSHAHRAAGDIDAATADLRQVRAVAQRLGDASVRTAILNELEMVLDRMSQARDEDARQQILAGAIVYARKQELTFRLSQFYLRQGIEQRRMDRLDEAERSLFSAVEQLERQRDTISEEEQRSTFLASRQEVFRELTLVLCRRRQYGRALEVVERSRARTLVEQMSQRSPKPHALLTYPQIQAALPPDTALVVLGEVGGHFGSWVVSSGEIRYAKMPMPRRDLEQRIERFRIALGNDDQRETVVASQVLYGAVVRAWYPHAQRFARLIISADAPFADIPFAALNDRHTGEFLMQRHVLSVAPSINALMAAGTRTPAAAKIATLVVAPSTSVGSAGHQVVLRDSLVEAGNLAKLYPSATVLEGEQATREEFIARASSAGLIHFAGHAMAKGAAVPHLVFASGGALYAEDIRALHFPSTRLVVLAACDSGSNRGARHTQGISSLARAFLAAGVPTVVASYWNVDDAVAARLSRRFHAFLSRGDDPATALRNAQLESLTSSDGRSRNVSSWAPFVVIGQPANR